LQSSISTANIKHVAISLIDKIRQKGDLSSLLDLPCDLALMFRAAARPALRHYFASIADEFSHQIDVLVINAHIRVGAEETNLPASRSETTAF
jgi:hypothetical protein